MNVLDIVFLAVLAFFLVHGFFRGIIRETASIAGLVLGFWAANTYFEKVVPWLEPYLADPGEVRTAAYLAVFAGVMLAVWVVLQILAGALKLKMLAAADHLLGGLMGFAKGAVICAVAVLVMAAFVPDSGYLADSSLVPYLAKVADFLEGFLPEEMRQGVRDGLQGLGEVELPLPDKPD
ncbi:CvpA family protein [Desulfohalovibrio reitneri]|uniref:CvpA family protein n=1 Tax=Desulfohalovibrio reitneri TaxID=1307759 RepID=UPI00055013C2|nr:CvpA family protein [Desulfohalovibrio reitneri]